MSELHPQSQSGFSRELWPKRLRDRIGLDAKLYSWRQLAGMFLGGLVLTVGCGFAIYDGTFDASHRYAYTGLRNALVKLLVYLGLSIPLVEFSLGLMAIAFFSTGCAYLAAVMLTKRRLGPVPDSDYETIQRLLPMHKDSAARGDPHQA